MSTTVRRLAALSIALAALGGGAARALGGGGPDCGAPQQAKDPLIVHEWGTFTSMQGSDGTTLEGLQHETGVFAGVFEGLDVRHGGGVRLGASWAGGSRCGGPGSCRGWS